MTGSAVKRQVADVAKAISERTDELAVQLARAIEREVHLYHAVALVPFEAVTAGCAANMRPISNAIAANTDFDATAATELGADRARDGLPLAAVMEAYRVGFRPLWDAVVAEAGNHAHADSAQCGC